jgi:hypothetical protein
MNYDQVPDWIVGFYLGLHIIEIATVDEDGTIVPQDQPFLVVETQPEARTAMFRLAIDAFRDEFNYPPSMVQVGDAAAEIWTLEKLASGELPNRQ